MLKRTITGACYVAFIVAFFLLREFVDYRIFHVLTYIFTILGTFETARMFKPFSIKANAIFAVIFSVLLVPHYLALEYFVLTGYGWLFSIGFIVLALLIVSLVCLIQNTDKKTYLATILPYVYPSLFLLPMLFMNEIGSNAFVALLLLFVISPLCDTMAYLVGSAIGGKKLCPKLSPKKTWSGAIGGLFGGAIGGLIVYFIFTPTVLTLSPTVTAVVFAVIGLISALLTEIGDLFESFIKRKAGVKDSGKILPGHGGVLDRIDGMLFASLFIYIIFLIV
ncbi:MAG: CDP-archaeol synthase [Clostridia bacterium]|nr:CDP-archaeol synthase [Clostridia bacterium]